MANNTSKPKKGTTKTAKTKVEQEVPAIEAKKYQVKQSLDPNMYVTVKNGFNGTLVYKSKKTGERFVWAAFGDEQEIELMELKAAKNSYKAFFINNWFLFDDPEIIEWLGVGQYYKNALNMEAFEKLFKKSPSEIKKIVDGLSAGQKKSVAYRARQLISTGDIDSIKVINTLEESLGVELIEK